MAIEQSSYFRSGTATGFDGDFLRGRHGAITGEEYGLDRLHGVLAASAEVGEIFCNHSDPVRRGAQLSIRLSSHGRDICDKLAGNGVIGDWREPDIFRVAAVPLYNSYTDVYGFVQRFAAALQ